MKRSEWIVRNESFRMNRSKVTFKMNRSKWIIQNEIFKLDGSKWTIQNGSFKMERSKWIVENVSFKTNRSFLISLGCAGAMLEILGFGIQKPWESTRKLSILGGWEGQAGAQGWHPGPELRAELAGLCCPANRVVYPHLSRAEILTRGAGYDSGIHRNRSNNNPCTYGSTPGIQLCTARLCDSVLLRCADCSVLCYAVLFCAALCYTK